MGRCAVDTSWRLTLRQPYPIWRIYVHFVYMCTCVSSDSRDYGVIFQEEETPLHCAAARGHTDCIRSLLDAGVDLNLVDKVGLLFIVIVISR